MWKNKWNVNIFCWSQDKADQLSVCVSLSLSVQTDLEQGSLRCFDEGPVELWTWPSCSAPCPLAQCTEDGNRAFTELSQHWWFCFHELGRSNHLTKLKTRITLTVDMLFWFMKYGKEQRLLLDQHGGIMEVQQKIECIYTTIWQKQIL